MDIRRPSRAGGSGPRGGGVGVERGGVAARTRRHLRRRDAACAVVVQSAIRAWLVRRATATGKVVGSRARAALVLTRFGRRLVAWIAADEVASGGARRRRLMCAVSVQSAVRVWLAGRAVATVKVAAARARATSALLRFGWRFVAWQAAQRVAARLRNERFELGLRIEAAEVVQAAYRRFAAQQLTKRLRREWILRLRRIGVTEWGLREWGLAGEVSPDFGSSDDWDPDDANLDDGASW